MTENASPGEENTQKTTEQTQGEAAQPLNPGQSAPPPREGIAGPPSQPAEGQSTETPGSKEAAEENMSADEESGQIVDNSPEGQQKAVEEDPNVEK